MAGAAYIGLGQGATTAPQGPACEGEGRDKHAKRKCPGRPWRTVPGQESAGGGEDVPDILGQHLDVLLVGERHGRRGSVGACAFAHMHVQPRRDTRHVGSRQGVKRHRFERWESVVARRPRDGHEFEGARPRFATRREGDFVRHLGLKHLEFRRPCELWLPQEFQVSTAFVRDFQGDGFVRGDAVGGQGLGHIQAGEGAD